MCSGARLPPCNKSDKSDKRDKSDSHISPHLSFPLGKASSSQGVPRRWELLVTTRRAGSTVHCSWVAV